MRYLRTPGYLRDLIQPSLLAYNKESLLIENALPDSKGRDIEYYEEVIRWGAPYPTDLSVFYTELDGRCVMSELIASLDAEDDESRFWEITADAGCMIDFACRMLPGDMHASGLSTPALVRRLEKAIPDGDVRLRLLAFFLDPAPYLELLNEDLHRRVQMLSQMNWEAQVLAGSVETEEEFDWTQLGHYLSADAETPFDLDGIRGYSYCLFARYAIERQANGVLLLGADYLKRVSSETARFTEIDLVQVGKLLSEPNRVRVLNLIHEKGEMCVSDVMPYMDSSTTVIYYHLDQMQKSGLLSARMVGRTQYFRINPRYLKALQIKFGSFLTSPERQAAENT